MEWRRILSRLAAAALSGILGGLVVVAAGMLKASVVLGNPFLYFSTLSAGMIVLTAVTAGVEGTLLFLLTQTALGGRPQLVIGGEGEGEKV